MTSPGLVPPAGWPISAKVAVGVAVALAVGALLLAVPPVREAVAVLITGAGLAWWRRGKANATARRTVADSAEASQEHADWMAIAAEQRAVRAREIEREEAARVAAAARIEEPPPPTGLTQEQTAEEKRLKDKWR